jgi:Do/DeqQ family serine protease
LPEINSNRNSVNFLIQSQVVVGMTRTVSLILVILLVAVAGGMIGSILTVKYLDYSITPYATISGRQEMQWAPVSLDSGYRLPKDQNFMRVANASVSGVVHIRTAYGPGMFSLNPLELYYKEPARPSGSGVLITDDGYIVTNNHVIEDATHIEVVLNNNQRYYAKVIGVDPSTDLALLKIKGTGLPFLRFGNSDNLQPGEWVLAIGNPFNLSSTVTAGIVSAKARNIGVLRDSNNLQVESFIQTDAAVNPGNSGGALINLKGELIGINTAIATTTGMYAGYSFAIPVTLVQKVMDDLKEFGKVQRGLLGVQIISVDANVAERMSLKVNQGVLVTRVNRGSAAEAAGMQQGDVITAIDRHEVTAVSELQEWVARNRPGKEIEVTVLRGEESLIVRTKLKNASGRDAVDIPEIRTEFNGAVFEDVNYSELNKLNLDGGVLLRSLSNGKWKDAGVKEGFVLAYLDKVPVENIIDLNRILEYKRGGVLIEGYYANGDKGIYALDW